MSPVDVVDRLYEIRREVVRLMPHIGCCPPFEVEHSYDPLCNCYKRDLYTALLRADLAVRESLGMEPF